MKRVIVSVSNDLVTDQRVRKVCETLTDMGFELLLVGRRLKNSLPMDHRRYQTYRMKLWFNKGPLFYAGLNVRLLFLLLLKKVDVLVSNDLDTLLPNFLVACLRKKHLVYDSHEIFCEVPELKGRYAKRVWERVEAFCFPRLQHVFTVNASISNWFFQKYGVRPHVLRNVPKAKKIIPSHKKEELGICENQRVILIQGAGINMDRGAEEAVQAIKYLEDVVLLIVGWGDVVEQLKGNVLEEQLNDKVIFVPKQLPDTLFLYTLIADVGLSLAKDTNLNYYFSLPNSLFDYLQAHVPVLVSDLPEVKKIVTRYQVGEWIECHDPIHIADKLRIMLEGHYKQTKRDRLARAASELVWENEIRVLTSVYKRFL